MKALIVNLCDLGDLLFSTPLIEALARDHETHYLADESCADAVRGHPALAQCWSLPRAGWTLALRDPAERPSALARALAWAEGLREQRFDVVYCLQARPLAAELAALAGGRETRGFIPKDGAVAAGEGCEVLLRHFRTFEARGMDGLHAAEGFLSLLASKRWPRRSRLSHAVVPTARERVQALLQGPGRRVAVLTGAGGSHKRWPLTAWLDCLRAWRRLFPRDRLLLLGGPDDAERGRLLAARVPGVEDLCGGLSFAESAAVLESCAAAVGGDTGPLHLAAAVGTPCLGLFGETHPDESCPLLPGSLALKAGGGRLDGLEPGPVLRSLACLLARESPRRLGHGVQVFHGREAEAERVEAAWARALAPSWLARQERTEDGHVPLKELAEHLMERARLGLERLEGPALAMVHCHISLQFKVFSEERA